LTAELENAVRHVEFYRSRVAPRSVLHLDEFPILSKSDVRDRFREICHDALADNLDRPRRGYSWVNVTTGGSTGTPVRVLHGPTYRDRGRAGRFFSQRLCGFPFGTPYVKLWGSMRDIGEDRASLVSAWLRRLARETPCNAFLMKPAQMTRYASAIRTSGIRHMMAYVDAAEEFARHVRQSGVTLSLDSVMACAGQVTDDARRQIAETFGARVHNKYGSRECAELACECERGGFHIYTPHVVLEVVDDSGKPVPVGQRGRLLVTLLGNHEFPLIRYEIGDVAALSSDRCDCGFDTTLLQSVEGRTVEWLRSSEGAYVSPVFVRHLVGVVHNDGSVRRFQLAQEAPAAFRLSLQFEAGTSDIRSTATADALLQDLQTVLGRDSRIVIERVADIAPLESGKYAYCVNRVRQGQNASVRDLASP